MGPLLREFLTTGPTATNLTFFYEGIKLQQMEGLMQVFGGYFSIVMII
jgi:hypothetical protein